MHFLQEPLLQLQITPLRPTTAWFYKQRSPRLPSQANSLELLALSEWVLLLSESFLQSVNWCFPNVKETVTLENDYFELLILILWLLRSTRLNLVLTAGEE